MLGMLATPNLFQDLVLPKGAPRVSLQLTVSILVMIHQPPRVAVRRSHLHASQVAHQCRYCSSCLVCTLCCALPTVRPLPGAYGHRCRHRGWTDGAWGKGKLTSVLCRPCPRPTRSSQQKHSHPGVPMYAQHTARLRCHHAG